MTEAERSRTTRERGEGTEFFESKGFFLSQRFDPIQVFHPGRVNGLTEMQKPGGPFAERFDRGTLKSQTPVTFSGKAEQKQSHGFIPKRRTGRSNLGGRTSVQTKHAIAMRTEKRVTRLVHQKFRGRLRRGRRAILKKKSEQLHKQSSRNGNHAFLSVEKLRLVRQPLRHRVRIIRQS